MYTVLLLTLLACSSPPPPGPSAPEVAPPEAPAPPAAEAPVPAPSTPLSSPADWSPMPPPDLVVVPGERFGPLTPSTTRDEVVELFSGATLVDTAVDLGEGYTAPGMTVRFGSGDALEIQWRDGDATGIAEVRARSPRWRTPEGLGLGLDLDGLHEILGPFRFYGFGWDRGGTVELAGTRAGTWSRHLFLVLAPAHDARDTEAYGRLTGDRLLASTEPDVAAVRPTVVEMRVRLSD